MLYINLSTKMHKSTDIKLHVKMYTYDLTVHLCTIKTTYILIPLPYATNNTAYGLGLLNLI
jgi:hypothetical protein